MAVNDRLTQRGGRSSMRPEGAGEGARPFVVRDTSKGTDTSKELGHGRASVFGIIASVDPGTGLVTRQVQGIPQPRNWHLAIGDKIDPQFSLKDKRISVALISDYENGFTGFRVQGASVPSSGGGSSSSAPGTNSGGGGVPPALPTGANGFNPGPNLGIPGTAVNLGTGVNPVTPGATIASVKAQLATNAVQQASARGAGQAGAVALATLIDQARQLQTQLNALFTAALRGTPANAGAAKGPITPDDPSNPFLSDWDFKQRSTRIIDCHNPKGRSALFAQLCKVVDDLEGEYTAAIPLGPGIGGHESAAAGYVWDDGEQRSGLLSAVFCTNAADIVGHGRDGTPGGLLGIRTDAHFEWNDGSDGHHGAAHFDTTDISQFLESSDGIPYKASLAWDPTVANANSENGHEAGHWRPWFRMKYFRPETSNSFIQPHDDYVPTEPFNPKLPSSTSNVGIFLEIPMTGNRTTGATPLTSSIGGFPKLVSYLSVYRNSAGVATLINSQQQASEAVSWGIGLPANTTVGNGDLPTNIAGGGVALAVYEGNVKIKTAPMFDHGYTAATLDLIGTLVSGQMFYATDTAQLWMGVA